jgi:hypothetical protein
MSLRRRWLAFCTLFLGLTACTANDGAQTVAPAALPRTQQPTTTPAAPQEAPVTSKALPPAPTAAPTPTTGVPVLPVIGPAPNWENEVWINSSEPLPLESLRGKVVLREFWTFG